MVYPGVYTENITFFGRNVVLTSTHASDAEVVANTVIDGGEFGSVVKFQGSENSTCVLSGFTIQNGGGAGVTGNQTHATIQHNRITGNSGSGLYRCNGTIQNNTITGNLASYGGGLNSCNGIVQNNVIADNSATCGGGLGGCGGITQNNRIRGNSASYGGGLWACDGTIGCNLITGNSADDYGGGLIYCDLLLNNTICGNSATYGGGLYECRGTIANCIIWGNTATEGAPLHSSGSPTYSCIQDWTGGGQGNISEDPRFIDPDGLDDDPKTYEDNDYRLLPDSPCIDAGINGGLGPADRDIAGMHRIMFGGKSFTVDMGAYEYYINELTPGPRAEEATLTWSSLADKTYSIFYTDDLCTWTGADESVPSAGNQTTSWTDDGWRTGLAPSLAPRRFYRILENP